MQEKQKKKKGGCIRFKESLLKFDILAQPFNFYLPDGTTQFKTTFGGCIFIIFFSIFLMYFCTVFISFFDRTKNYSLLESSYENNIVNEENYLGKEDNFAIAAAFASNIPGEQYRDDPEIG